MSESNESAAPHRTSDSVPAMLGHGVRLLVLGALGLALLALLIGGTMETRLAFLVAALLGFAHPRWGFFALALLGPLYLNGAGANAMMPTVDALALGTVAGALRLWGREGDGVASAASMRFGLWPAWLAAVAIVVLVSFFPNAIRILFDESGRSGIAWLRHVAGSAVWGWETTIYWGARSVWNWMLGIGLAIAAARWATVAFGWRFLQCGALGLLAACLAGLLEEVIRHSGGTWFSLTGIRTINLDPQQFGRFQGTAGHGGWFAQWLTLFWVGMLPWAVGSARKLRWAALGVLALFAFCLVVTAARVAWFGALGGGLLVGAALFARMPQARKALLFVPVALMAVAVIGYFVGGDVISSRVDRLLRITDRINYFSSGFIFLREYPLGIGIGSHFVQYEAWLNSRFHYHQYDHATSHNTWLHLLIENGPLLPLLLAGGLLAAFLTAFAGWKRSDSSNEALLFAALGATIAAIAIVSMAQYFFYIRAVEFSIWTLGGLTVGLASRAAARAEKPKRAPALLALSCALLLLTGVVGAAMLQQHKARPLVENPLRHWDYNCTDDGCFYSKWTSAHERFVIEPTVHFVHLSLFRVETPASVRVTWPDGYVEEFRMEADTFRWLYRELEPTVYLDDEKRDVLFDPRRFMTIEVDRLHTPGRWTWAADPRPLGVLINHFWQYYYWEEKPEGPPFTRQ